MSSKLEMFQNAGNESDFSVRDAISFSVDEDQQRIGRKAMKNVAQLDLTQIIAKDQVRTSYDPQKHTEMVASLTTHGQQQPIVVYWSEEDSKYVVFVGHRRTRAAREVDGITSLAAVILKEAPTESERLEIQLVENLVRENLNPVDEARAFADIIRVRGINYKILAKELGKATSTVQRACKMLDLPEDILEAVATRKLPKRVAQEISKVDNEEGQREMFDAYKSGLKYTDIAEAVTAKPRTAIAGSTTKKTPKTKKVFSSGGVKLQATAAKKVTKAEIAAALRAWADDLESDGRSRSRAA